MTHQPSGPIPRPTSGPLWPHIATNMPRYDFLDKLLHDPPLRQFALTCYREAGALRLVTLANGWHLLLEQIDSATYRSMAESANRDALHKWLAAHYPDEAVYGMWRWEPWLHWRNDHLPTGTYGPIV